LSAKGAATLILTIESDGPEWAKKLHDSYLEQLTEETDARQEKFEAGEKSTYKKLVDIMCANRKDRIIITDQAFPFLDIELTRHALEILEKEKAELCFGDLWPEGSIPFVFAPEAALHLRELLKEEGSLPAEGAVFIETLKRDMNMMNIAPLFPDPAILEMRLNFSLHDPYGKILTSALSKLDSCSDSRSPGIEELIRTIVAAPELKRGAPRVLEIELTNRCLLKCFFCPHTQETTEHDMKPELLDRILNEFGAISPEGMVIFSGYGEPFLWNDFESMVLKRAAEHPNQLFLIETNGIELGAEFGAALTGAGIRNVFVMVSLDAADENKYEQWKGEDFYEDIKENILSFAEAYQIPIPRLAKRSLGDIKRVTVNFVKSEKTYPELAAFFDLWKNEKNIAVNITKFRNYGGGLGDKTLADTAPSVRFPCFHLERELFVRADGRVPLCSQDSNTTKLLGNAEKENLSIIWDRSHSNFTEHAKEPSCYEICSGCDEWHVPTTL